MSKRECFVLIGVHSGYSVGIDLLFMDLVSIPRFQPRGQTRLILLRRIRVIQTLSFVLFTKTLAVTVCQISKMTHESTLISLHSVRSTITECCGLSLK